MGLCEAVFVYLKFVYVKDETKMQTSVYLF